MNQNFILTQILTPKDAVYYISNNSTIRQALEKFAYHKFSVVPVIDEQGKYLNTLSEGDILRYIAIENNFDKKLSENTSIDDIEHYRSYSSVNISCGFEEIYELILSQNFIPVVDDRNIFIGIVKRKDVLAYLRKRNS